MNIDDIYKRCNLCPNYCYVDRTNNELGVCCESNVTRVAWSGLHRGEEPPVTGRKGSGMIFFSGCPLHCKYCQNYQISGGVNKRDGNVGLKVSTEELSTMMLKLQEIGANNINLVTGTHFIVDIVKAIEISKVNGLTIPLVWNTSGYESVEGLSLIDPYIDLYLIDLKTLDEEVSKKFCGRENYAKVIKGVFDYLIKKHPKYKFKGQFDTPDGLLVRHLVFPGTIKKSLKVLEYFAQSGLKDKSFLSLMVQFTSPKNSSEFKKITEEEYDILLTYLDLLDIDNGFIQELGDDIEWIPDFKKDIPFPKSFCNPLPYFIELKRRANGTVCS